MATRKKRRSVTSNYCVLYDCTKRRGHPGAHHFKIGTRHARSRKR